MKLRSVTVGAIATAMLATSATPAMAQHYPGYGYGYPGYGSPGYGYPGYGYEDYRHRDYRRRDRGSDAGAVIAGVAMIGIIAAIAASASRSRSQPSWSNRNRGGIDSESAATDACATGVEQRLGGSARVTDIDDVARTSEGYRVRGRVDLRERSDRDRQSFSCTVRYGGVERIDFGSYAFNY